jgi:putative transposase
MLRFTFKRGLKIRCGIKEWGLQKQLANGQLYFETDEGEPLSISRSEFYQKYLGKEWIVVEDGLKEREGLYEATPRDLQTFSQELQQKAIRKYEYVKAILDNGKFISSPSRLQPKIREIAKRIQDTTPPSPVTVYRWYRRFMNGKSIVNLVDLNEMKGRRVDIGGEVLELLQDVLDTVYLNPQQNPIKAVYDKLCGEIRQLNAGRTKSAQLKAPGRATVYRYINRLEAYSVDVSRLGKAEADRRFSSVTGEQTTDRLLERWEIDHTPLDIILTIYLDDGPRTVGRPWISVIIDKYSRMVMGFYISFHTPSANSVMKCLKHAILPKEAFLAQFDDIKCTWPAFGLPERLVCDNGMDLHASALAKVCRELGIQQQFCPAKSPKYKGTIERFFRRLNEELIHSLPGTVFSNPEQRGDYPSERMACIDLGTLTHIVAKWIVDIYHQTPHKTIRVAPEAKWHEGLKHRVGIELPADPEQLFVIMGTPVQRTVFHYGLEVNSLYYNSPSLQSLRRRLGSKIRVELKYYEDDLGYIHVFDPTHREYFKVPAIKYDYADGLTLDQHEVINRLLKEKSMPEGIDLFERREELKVLVCQAQKAKKMAQRKQGAVLTGIDSEWPAGRPTYTKATSYPVMPAAIPPAAINPDIPLPNLTVTPRLGFTRQKGLWGEDHE